MKVLMKITLMVLLSAFSVSCSNDMEEEFTADHENVEEPDSKRRGDPAAPADPGEDDD